MNRDQAGYLEGIVSILVNGFLFVLKFWAGTVSGSIALIADAWHTLSDSISSVIVITGVKLSSRKPSEKHPFGYGKWEQIAAIFIGFMLALIAYDFAKTSIQHFRDQESANFGTIALVVTIISIFTKEALAQYALYIYRKTNNTSIKADAWHHRTDALSSVVVLIGILLKDYFWWIDAVLGFIISLMLFYAVYEILKEAIEKLLGEKPSAQLIEQLGKIAERTGGPGLKPHHFHIHNYVKHKELTFHIKLNGDTSIKEGHEVATRIENEIRQQLNIETTIHIEPEGVAHTKPKKIS
jgi:cation diffusion facilitator family transporter